MFVSNHCDMERKCLLCSKSLSQLNFDGNAGSQSLLSELSTKSFENEMKITTSSTKRKTRSHVDFSLQSFLYPVLQEEEEVSTENGSVKDFDCFEINETDYVQEYNDQTQIPSNHWYFEDIFNNDKFYSDESIGNVEETYSESSSVNELLAVEPEVLESDIEFESYENVEYHQHSSESDLSNDDLSFTNFNTNKTLLRKSNLFVILQSIAEETLQDLNSEGNEVFVSSESYIQDSCMYQTNPTITGFDSLYVKCPKNKRLCELSPNESLTKNLTDTCSRKTELKLINNSNDHSKSTIYVNKEKTVSLFNFHEQLSKDDSFICETNYSFSDISDIYVPKLGDMRNRRNSLDSSISHKTSQNNSKFSRKLHDVFVEGPQKNICTSKPPPSPKSSKRKQVENVDLCSNHSSYAQSKQDSEESISGELIVENQIENNNETTYSKECLLPNSDSRSQNIFKEIISTPLNDSQTLYIATSNSFIYQTHADITKLCNDENIDVQNELKDPILIFDYSMGSDDNIFSSLPNIRIYDSMFIPLTERPCSCPEVNLIFSKVIADSTMNGKTEHITNSVVECEINSTHDDTLNKELSKFEEVLSRIISPDLINDSNKCISSSPALLDGTCGIAEDSPAARSEERVVYTASRTAVEEANSNKQISISSSSTCTDESAPVNFRNCVSSHIISQDLINDSNNYISSSPALPNGTCGIAEDSPAARSEARVVYTASRTAVEKATSNEQISKSSSSTCSDESAPVNFRHCVKRKQNIDQHIRNRQYNRSSVPEELFHPYITYSDIAPNPAPYFENYHVDYHPYQNDKAYTPFSKFSPSSCDNFYSDKYRHDTKYHDQNVYSDKYRHDSKYHDIATACLHRYNNKDFNLDPEPTDYYKKSSLYYRPTIVSPVDLPCELYYMDDYT